MNQKCNVNITHVTPAVEENFYALAAEYLPGSDPEVMKSRAMRYAKTFLVLMLEEEVVGVAYGWPRSLDAPEDASFTLDGIAVKEPYQQQGLGTRLLKVFEDGAREYGFDTVSVGSAGGYVEKFYIGNGFVPIHYKICTEEGIQMVKKFRDMDDYYDYERPETDGFVVLEKRYD